MSKYYMKIKKYLSILLVMWSFSGFGQKIVLEGNWKYAVAEYRSFSSSLFNDSAWQQKDAGSLLLKKEELGGSKGYALLRKKVIIPSTFKPELRKTGTLSIFLGRIYQSDSVYFNGRLIGSTSSSDIKRNYILPTNDIQWDRENVIAIRMRHWGDISGLETGKPYIAAAPPSTVFVLNSDTRDEDKQVQINGRQIDYNLVVTNRSSIKTGADITAYFYDLSGKQLNSITKKITLDTGRNIARFTYKSPLPFIKVHYKVSIPRYTLTAGWNDAFGYNTVVYRSGQAVIADKVKDQFIPADVQQQVIKGWLGDRLRINEEKRLLQVDENAILAGFINRPGSHPWIGEHVGKFLDASANTYRNTGNKELKIRMDRTVQQLIATQLEDGYLGTYSPESHWTSWDVWSHKYNIIGLLNYYSLSGFKPSLDAAMKSGNLLCKTFGYNSGQKDLIKAGTHVGMASTSVLEPMVDLYRFTGDQKYLDFCYYIIKSMDQENGPKIISTLNATAGRVDKTANAKAYEMLSNLVGIVKLYKLTADQRFLTPVLLAWKNIVEGKLYITGTASSFEHFKEEGVLPAEDKDHMGEGCVTTTWLQFNYHLLCITGEMKYIDELERSVYNHLTGAENPQSGCVSYYTPLVGAKPYRCVITCCMSSIPRGISMIPLFANGTMEGKPSFLFYRSGEYTAMLAGQKKISFNMTTDFPVNGDVSITVISAQPSKIPVMFRKPYWAADFVIKVNGEDQATDGKEAAFIDRLWTKGDKISITFKMPLVLLNGGKSYPGNIAFQRGPQVLAYDQSLNKTELKSVYINGKDTTLTDASNALSSPWIGMQAYFINSYGEGLKGPIVLVPYADAGQSNGYVQTWLPVKKD